MEESAVVKGGGSVITGELAPSPVVGGVVSHNRVELFVQARRPLNDVVLTLAESGSISTNVRSRRLAMAAFNNFGAENEVY